jgi:hypothetical protein
MIDEAKWGVVSRHSAATAWRAQEFESTEEHNRAVERGWWSAKYCRGRAGRD